MRSAILLPLIVCGLFGQSSQPRSEEDRAAEMKKRVVETLNLRPGDTAADVGCGDGFYTIPLARFLGPSGKVYAEDISVVVVALAVIAAAFQNLSKCGEASFWPFKRAACDNLTL